MLEGGGNGRAVITADKLSNSSSHTSGYFLGALGLFRAFLVVLKGVCHSSSPFVITVTKTGITSQTMMYFSAVPHVSVPKPNQSKNDQFELICGFTETHFANIYSGSRSDRAGLDVSLCPPYALSCMPKNCND